MKSTSSTRPTSYKPDTDTDGLRVICAGLDNGPEKIGIHMPEMLAKFRNDGLFDIAVEDE